MTDIDIRTALVAKMNPRTIQASPKMHAIIGGILGESWVTPQPTSFSITSDGYVISQPGHRESGDFLGDASDFTRNVKGYVETAGLTESESILFWIMYDQRVQDWR